MNHLNYPCLNFTLLYNSDATTKLRLVSQLTRYTLENLSVKGSAWTRDDFLRLTRAILDPAYRPEFEAQARRLGYPEEFQFSPRSGIIKHLKLISKRTGEADNSDDLLRQVYLSEAPRTS